MGRTGSPANTEALSEGVVLCFRQSWPVQGNTRFLLTLLALYQLCHVSLCAQAALDVVQSAGTLA